jgi:hypothetical protein
VTVREGGRFAVGLVFCNGFCAARYRHANYQLIFGAVGSFAPMPASKPVAMADPDRTIRAERVHHEGPADGDATSACKPRSFDTNTPPLTAREDASRIALVC